MDAPAARKKHQSNFLVTINTNAVVQDDEQEQRISDGLMDAFRSMATTEGFDQIVEIRWPGDTMEQVERIEVPDWATEIGHAPRGSRIHLHGN